MYRRSMLGSAPALGLGAILGLASTSTLRAPRTAEAPTDYDRIEADGEPLKAAFNGQAGHVRVVMLVAPT